MDLPVRIAREPAGEPVISVDGAWDAPGLNLSHWPGNTTPAELRHDLSTGAALAFSALPERRQRELARGCVAIENNHHDTDGTCALFAVRHPDLALPRAGRLIAAAAAGDFFDFPDEHALCVDAIVGGATDPERSPWRERLEGLEGSERHEAALHALLEAFPAILDGALEPYAALWQPALADARADRADLARAARDEIVHLDLCAWTAPHGARSSRPDAPDAFDPGRHALFGSTRADRVLVIGPGERGTTYRFLLSTLSWFDLATRTAQPRPDLAALAERLNELEGVAPEDAVAWRAQGSGEPSPELWFGTPAEERFAEHAACLRPSRLQPAAVRRAIADALRARWIFPD